jgi:hypothetical protein
VDVTQPPYSVRYPELSGLSENPDVNMIWRNLLYNCGPFLTRDRGIEALADNYIAEQDPGFINAASGDFQLKKGAAAFDKLGLRRIPFDEMGLYEHPLRASWPVEEKK